MHIETVIVLGIPVGVTGNSSQRLERLTLIADRSAACITKHSPTEFGTRSHSTRELASMFAGVLTASADLQQLQNS
jgi:hypothetical protein